MNRRRNNGNSTAIDLSRLAVDGDAVEGENDAPSPACERGVHAGFSNR
jgi:hypothetical protein